MEDKTVFGSVLIKSFKIDDRAFHILCDMNSTANDIEKLGIELISISRQLTERSKKEEEKENVDS